MTTSPEALREAVERLTASANGENQLTIGRNVFVQMTDLTLVLSALQEAREAMGPFAEAVGDGDDNSAHDGTPLWDHSLGDRITVGSFRRAAAVYRALSPGGADD